MERTRQVGSLCRADEMLELAADAEQRARELATLLDVSRTVGSTLELGPLLEVILDQLKTVVDYSGAGLASFEGGTQTFLDYRGLLPRERVLGLRRPTAWDRYAEEAIRRQGPVITEELSGASPLTLALSHDGAPLPAEAWQHARAGLCVPLIAKGRVVGILNLVHETPGFYTERHGQLAMAFAQQAAAAMENARLFEQAQRTAALEERQRLARELHDSLSQALYAIALNVGAAQRAYAVDTERVPELLEEALRLAEAGLIESRLLIFELRPDSLEREGLVAAIERQVDGLRTRHGLSVRGVFGLEPDVPLATKEAVYRIAQEAMHNITKHARARTVDVRLTVRRAELVLAIQDDGRGFDPQGSYPGHFGLQSMRERAALIGGRLEIFSTHGAGTRIRVRIPKTGQAA